ncbi:MAG TPA: ABC transporter substrate-binding protein [Acidobacteriota bacterium]|nr:ABC transporter substrate-binding protein [Acidobacteriota bacterium]
MFGHYLGVLCFVVVLPQTPTAAQERPKVFLGASSKTLGYSSLWVGAKRGFFEQQGLDVQLVLLHGVPMTLQALAAGSLHLGSGGPEPYIEAGERGFDFAIAGGIVNGMAQVIIAGKNYKSVEDLRGSTTTATPPSILFPWKCRSSRLTLSRAGNIIRKIGFGLSTANPTSRG